MNKKALVFTGMGFELVGMIFAGLFLGQQVDETWQLQGLGTAFFSFVVLAGWLWHLVILIKRFQSDKS